MVREYASGTDATRISVADWELGDGSTYQVRLDVQLEVNESGKHADLFGGSLEGRRALLGEDVVVVGLDKVTESPIEVALEARVVEKSDLHVVSEFEIIRPCNYEKKVTDISSGFSCLNSHVGLIDWRKCGMIMPMVGSELTSG